MPTSVARFEALMYLVVGVEVFGAVFNFPRVSGQVGFASALLQLVIAFGIRVLLIYLIARRRAGWARWVLSVLVVLGWLGFGIVLSKHLETLVSTVCSVGAIIGEAVALFLVFSAGARPWFQKGAAAGRAA